MGILYTAHVTSHGGREGVIRSSDGHLNMKLVQPKEGQTEGTNPEQLFAAGYAACFHSALKSIAKSKDIPCDNSEVTANVSLSEGEKAVYKLSVRLDVAIPGLEDAQVQEVMEMAHQTCPYSKATRGNIDVELKVIQTKTPQTT
ncbi:organic hydroperoxide resistance protein [Paenibacillus mendelii]|uniref:Organic hydroperoxide resistance protein n=1 Tax=Paenibacillus mendelii TaxID=206163 RepID=A0ABV6J6I0_9BACL|nr:organic hydroperoxide resistance protein [Paenibacillus mendelii]MCQ6561152.1 organic hydroperoxide resistance protein [Paenibacillus mendelii]